MKTSPEPACQKRRTQSPALTRRHFLKTGAGALGIVTLGAMGCRGQAVPPSVTEAGRFFTEAEMRILADVVDRMLPETSTPGALSANVPAWLDDMMTSWASGETRAAFRQVIASYDEAAQETFGARYLELDREERFSIAQGVDELGFSRAGGAYRYFKSLVYHGYATSRQVNPDYRIVPGAYRGCVSREQHAALLARGTE